MEKKPAIIKTVKWFLLDKNPPLIKFVEDEDAYPISDKVISVSNFSKYPIVQGDQVEVGISYNEVTFLRKVKNYTKTSEPQVEKSEPKQEVTKPVEQTNSVTVAELTSTKETVIQAVARNKKVLKIKDDTNWYDISQELQNKDYTTIGLIAGKSVLLKFDGKTIVAVDVKEEKAPISTDEAVSGNNRVQVDQRQESIELQACINSACDIVATMVTKSDKVPTIEMINDAKRRIAEDSYKWLQSNKR